MKIRLIVFMILMILPVAAFAAGDDEDEKLDKGLTAVEDKEGVYLRRKYKADYEHYDEHHTLPDDYLVAVPKDKPRKGPMEHLMFEIDSDFESLYVSKELRCSRGPVWQASGTVEFYGLGFNVWSNFVLNDEPNQGEFNEVDLTTYYTFHIHDLTIHPYFVFMVFPNGNPASLDYSSESIIEADLYLQYDLWKFDFFGRMRTRLKPNAGSIYAHVGVGFHHDFNDMVTIETSTHLGMGDSKYLTSAYGQRDANVDALAFVVAVPLEVVRGFTLRPHFNAVVHVIPSIRRAIRANPNQKSYLIWGGLDLAYNF
ncbi:MAG: hypothetical protein HN337_03580 [Deltaproteobacteria bacterium]|jgi:hypothetical protein|nr:hypothetical protein [Deltaproteobacteria bacterium]